MSATRKTFKEVRAQNKGLMGEFDAPFHDTRLATILDELEKRIERLEDALDDLTTEFQSNLYDK